MSIERVLAALDERDCRVRGNFQRGWTALCPAHNDVRSPSLSVGYRSDRVLIHCFTGCSTEAVLDALCLTWTDLFEEEAESWRRS